MVTDSASHQVRQGAIVNALGTAGKLAGPAFLVLVSRLYGPDVWGIYATAYALVQMLHALLTSGLADGTIMYVANYLGKPEEDDGNYRAIATAIVVGVAGSLLPVIFFVAGGDRLIADQFEFGDRLKPVLLWMGAALPLMALERAILSATQGLGIMKYQAIVAGIARPLLLLGAAAAAWFVRPDETGIAVSFLGAQVLVTAMAVACFGCEFSWSALRASLRRFRAHPGLIRFTIPQSINATFDRFTTNVDVLILGLLGATATTTGFYSAGALIVRELRHIKLIFSSALSPQIARLYKAGQRAELSHVLSSTARWTSAAAIPVIVVVGLLRNDLMWVVNSSYGDLDALFILLLLPIPILKCSVGMAGNVVVMTGRPRLNLINGLTEGTLNVLLNLWLIPKFGLMGAAGASSIAAVVRATMEVTEIYRLVNVRFIPSIMIGPLAAGLLAVFFIVATKVLTDVAATLPGRVAVAVGAIAVFALFMVVNRPRSSRETPATDSEP